MELQSDFKYCDESYSRILSAYSETTNLQVNNTQFTFSRVSPQSSSPLESVLLISPVSSYLNGTVVSCTDRSTGKSSSTIINIITDLGKSIITLILYEREKVAKILKLSHYLVILLHHACTRVFLSDQ